MKDELSLFELLEELRLRPGMFISPPCALSLWAYLGGFVEGRTPARLSERELMFSKEFTGWLAAEYRLSPQSGWCKMLQFLAWSEAEELPLFFRLYDQFVAARK
jgi:hypothetical protein